MHKVARFALLAGLVAAPLRAETPIADLKVSLRCAAAFGIVANEQQRGIAAARADYPPLGARGREFFVQVGARLMDEEKLDRPAMQARFKAEVEALQAESMSAADPRASVAAIMGPCLKLLDASVPDAGRTP
ncbi:MAG: hypothetical protein ACREBO_01750 [Novosphingobium sp.]